MANFVSTTTPSSYADAGRAMTIKALEKRYADMMAQQAQQAIPDSIPTPIQGVGHVVNQLAEGVRAAQLQSQAAAQKDALAAVMSGIDWEKGPTAQQPS